MKVNQLIKELEKLNPEAEIGTYIGEAEEFGTVDSVEVHTDQETLPYAKGDQPEVKGELILIKGTIA